MEITGKVVTGIDLVLSFVNDGPKDSTFLVEYNFGSTHKKFHTWSHDITPT